MVVKQRTEQLRNFPAMNLFIMENAGKSMIKPEGRSIVLS